MPGLRTGDILGRTYRRFFWDTYDHLGILILANLMWLACSLPVVTMPAATAALFHIGRKIYDRERVSPGDFAIGFRLHFLPASKAGLFSAAAFLALWVNIDFYSHLRGRAEIPGLVFAAALMWVAAFLLLMHVHLFPVIVSGERSLIRALRTSALLTLDNIGVTAALLAQALAVAAICAATGVGVLLIVASALAVLLTTARYQLLRKYNPPGEPRQEPEETRGWRDLFQPWRAQGGR